MRLRKACVEKTAGGTYSRGKTGFVLSSPQSPGLSPEPMMLQTRD